jgi:hypothetical protein
MYCGAPLGHGGRSMPSLFKETTMFIRAVSPWSRCHTRVATLAALAVVALFALAGSAQAATPSNDDFANATVLSGSSGSESGTNVDATAEAGDPNNHQAECCTANDLGGVSVWYEWTAPASGLVGFDTDALDTNEDTVLGVYTGNLGSLNEVEFNDDYGGNCCTSRVVFNATAGQTYKLAVGVCCGIPVSPSALGPFKLQWGPATRPGNDDFASATPIAGSSGTLAGSTFDASAQAGEPKHHKSAGDLGGDSVWYSWTAPASGRYAFTAPGTIWSVLSGPFVPAIGAYTGDLSKLSEVGYGTGALGFEATAGTTYSIGVGGDSNQNVSNRVYWGDMGSYTLTWAPDDIAPDTTITSSSGGIKSVTYAFTGSDNHTSPGNLRFECKLDSSAFAPCKSPKTFSGISSGRHTVQVRAIDEASNVDPTPAVTRIRAKHGPKAVAATAARAKKKSHSTRKKSYAKRKAELLRSRQQA